MVLGVASVLAGCGGDDAPPAETTGALTVTISAPAGTTPEVTVDGPDGFTTSLQATATLVDLAPGMYTVATGAVVELGSVVNTIHDAVVVGAPATVQPGAMTDVEITFEPRTGTGHLWYADSSNSAISSLAAGVLGATGSPTPTVGLGVATAGSPSAPTFTADGSLWFVTGGTSAINRFAPEVLGTTGTPLVTTRISTAPAYPHGLSFDAMGNLWTGSLSTPSKLYRYAAADLAGTGELAISPVATLTVTPASSILSSITVDGEGNLWVSYRSLAIPDVGTIYKLAPGQIATTGSPTPTKVLTSPDMLVPTALAIDRHGNLWVANFSTTLGAPSNIVRFDAAQLAGGGTATASAFQISSSGINDPNDLAFDESGNLWVCNGSAGTTTLVRFPASQLVGSGTATLTPDVTITTSAGGHAGIAFDPPP